jgi:hypothetical protein
MGTEKQEKHTVSIAFLFTSEGHEAIWEPWILFFCSSGFLTRPDTNLHRQGLVWDFCLSSLELSHKVRCRLTQARWATAGSNSTFFFPFHFEIWGLGYSSVGKCLLSMCKALGSIPSITTKEIKIQIKLENRWQETSLNFGSLERIKLSYLIRQKEVFCFFIKQIYLLFHILINKVLDWI